MWSRIARSLIRRTDNDIKNHWNTRLSKKLVAMGVDPVTHLPHAGSVLPTTFPDHSRLQPDATNLHLFQGLVWQWQLLAAATSAALPPPVPNTGLMASLLGAAGQFNGLVNMPAAHEHGLAGSGFSSAMAAWVDVGLSSMAVGHEEANGFNSMVPMAPEPSTKAVTSSPVTCKIGEGAADTASSAAAPASSQLQCLNYLDELGTDGGWEEFLE